jgi:hypothetical protein
VPAKLRFAQFGFAQQKSRRKTAFLLCWQRTLQNGGLKISPGGVA